MGMEQERKSVEEVAEFLGIPPAVVDRMVKLNVLTSVEEGEERYIDISDWREAGKREALPPLPEAGGDYRPSPRDLERLLDQADPRQAPLRQPITEDPSFWAGCEILTGSSYRQLMDIKKSLSTMDRLLSEAREKLLDLEKAQQAVIGLVPAAMFHLLEGAVSTEEATHIQEIERHWWRREGLPVDTEKGMDLLMQEWGEILEKAAQEGTAPQAPLVPQSVKESLGAEEVTGIVPDILERIAVASNRPDHYPARTVPRTDNKTDEP